MCMNKRALVRARTNYLCTGTIPCPACPSVQAALGRLKLLLREHFWEPVSACIEKVIASAF